jgi:pimeloyl-ACP methyl ester carboxylesterase
LQNPWETTDIDALVSVSHHHKLYVSTSGPERTPGSPVVLFFSGGGTPSAAYIRFRRLLSSHVRVLFHDRAGYGYSELGRGDISCSKGNEVVLTAQHAARELHHLLQVLRVGPPYVLVGHSYGCICARAFLALLSREQQRAGGGVEPLASAVAGMVLVEAATELMYDLFEPSIPPRYSSTSRGASTMAPSRAPASAPA